MPNARPASRLASYADAVNHAAALALHGTRLALIRAGLPIRRENLSITCMDGTSATGLFSEMMVILGALDHYERWEKCYSGLNVDYGLRGHYGDPAAGPNWWEYFFQPLRISAAPGMDMAPLERHLYRRFAAAGEALQRRRAFSLIERYVRPVRRIEESAQRFADAQFQGTFVVGVHYRGTDKHLEAPRVPYEEVDTEIRTLGAAAPGGRYKVFVATDERAFLDFMTRRHSGRVLFRDIFRSVDGRPIHHASPDSNSRKGEDAVLDCLLLSRCNHLVRTASALSLYATYVNPDLPVRLLNHQVRGGPLSESLRRLARALRARVRAFADAGAPRLRLAAIRLGLPLKRRYIILRSRGDGLFSEINAILGALDHYEAWRPLYAGLRLDFADGGRYFDHAAGPNWWTYYFEPLRLGSEVGAIQAEFDGRRHDAFAAHGASKLSRQRAAELIARYLRPRAEFIAGVEAFAREHFRGAHVIGVHYRGTDKAAETERVPYERVLDAVLSAIRAAAHSHVRVFVATDEAAFLTFMLESLPGAVLYATAARSTDGSALHDYGPEARRRGAEAVVDCLLLARTQVLVRTSSNLGRYATYVNPQLPVTLLDAAQ